MDIFHRLGMIMMVINDSKDYITQLFKSFFAEFNDQTQFLENFKNTQCKGEGRIGELTIQSPHRIHTIHIL